MMHFEKSEIDRKFWKGLNLVQGNLNISDLTLSQKAELNWQKFSFCKKNNLGLPFYSLEKLSLYLKIPLDKLIKGEISHELTPQLIQSEILRNLPEKYQIGRGSKSFTLRHLLKLADRHHLRQEVLSEFNIMENLIEAKVDFEIPVQLVADVIDFIASKVTLREQDFDYLASLNAFYFKDSAFGKLLRSATKPHELYENLIFVTRYLEENWSYEISSIKNDQLLLTSHPNESLTEIYKRKDYSSLNFTRFRIAVATNLLQYIGIGSVKSNITKSIHEGNDCDQFMIDLKTIKQQSSRPELFLQ